MHNPPLVDLDYPFLKEQGIAYIQRLAGKLWTDYNEHDPGITLLEELCFAIVDLEYRTNFYIEDLLAPNPDVPQTENTQDFYYAEEILPCNPLTCIDFLKIVVDVEGVRNAKISTYTEPHGIRGGYRVLLDLEDRVLQNQQEKEIQQTVQKRLYQHRNLCEDFFEIGLLKPLYLRITAEFEVKLDLAYKESELLIAESLFSIQSFIAPYIPFYSLSKLLAKKANRVDRVFTGPLLQHGFVDTEEVEQSIQRSTIYIADILAQATAIPGIESAVSFAIAADAQEPVTDAVLIDVPFDRVLKLDVPQCAITLYHNGFPVQVNTEKVQYYFDELAYKGSLKKTYLAEEEIAVPTGRFRNLADHPSIQHNFPLVYGVGVEGLSHSATKTRKSQANQLKGYLLFFDQLLANYCAELAQIKDLLAVQHEEVENLSTGSQLPTDVPYLQRLLKSPCSADKQKDIAFAIQQKYLNILCKETKAKDTVDASTLQDLHLNYLEKITLGKKAYTQKRNHLLDHLLARFAEVFTTYSLLLYEDEHEQGMHLFRYDKALFLKDYIAISRDRNKGIDLTDATNYGWDSDNISGFERRIYRRLGIKNLKRRFLYKALINNFYLEHAITKHSLEIFLGKQLQSKYDNILIFKGNFPQIRNLAIRYGITADNYDILEQDDRCEIILYVDNKKSKYIQLVDEQLAIKNIEQAEKIIQQAARFFTTFSKQNEGFHLVEHILLRNGTTFQGANDPYSCIMTMVFPDWPVRFQKKAFRDLVHEIIMTESPAHIFVNVLWLNIEEIESFEKAYKHWLHLRTTLPPDDIRLIQAATSLLGLIMLYSSSDQ